MTVKPQEGCFGSYSGPYRARQRFLRVGVGPQACQGTVRGDIGLRGTIGNRGAVCNGRSDQTEGFYVVKRGGSSERK